MDRVNGLRERRTISLSPHRFPLFHSFLLIHLLLLLLLIIRLLLLFFFLFFFIYLFIFFLLVVVLVSFFLPPFYFFFSFLFSYLPLSFSSRWTKEQGLGQRMSFTTWPRGHSVFLMLIRSLCFHVNARETDHRERWPYNDYQLITKTKEFQRILQKFVLKKSQQLSRTVHIYNKLWPAFN